MKIDIRLPGGGEIYMEKQPMSEEQKETALLALLPISLLVFMVLVFIITR